MSENTALNEILCGDGAEHADARWAPFEDTKIDVLIRPLTSKEFNSLGRRATKAKYVKHQRQDDVDTVKLNGLLIGRCVLDWRGMTGQRFCKFAHIKAERVAKAFGISEDQLATAEVPFSTEVARIFGEQCFGFWNFVYEAATSMGEEVEEEGKN